MIDNNDISELRRLATNSYDGDKIFMNNFIQKLSNMQKEMKKLQAEVNELKNK